MGRASVILALLVVAHAQPDHLRNALKPLKRNARDIADPLLYGNEYYQENGNLGYDYPSDEIDPRIVLEKPYPMTYPEKFRNSALEKVLQDYAEDNRGPGNEGIKKRVLTSFRERMENEKSKEQHETMAELFLRKLEEEEKNAEREYETDRDYMEMLEELWEKYKSSHPELYINVDHNRDYMAEEVKKRQYSSDYPLLGLSAAGYRKRAYPGDMEVPNDALDFLNYSPQEDVLNRLRGEEEDDSDRYDFLRTNQDPYRQRLSSRPRNNRYGQDMQYSKRKRFPVAKRSSNFYGSPMAGGHKKMYVKDQKEDKKDASSGTDPKIVKDLTNIFGAKESNETYPEVKSKKLVKKNDKNEKTTQKATVTEAPDKNSTVSPTVPYKHEHHHHSSEHAKAKGKSNKGKEKDTEEPLKIKKKSVDWSNYFGIDRRKKSSDYNKNKIDNEWLVERYQQAVASARKKSTEYPLNFFKNHEPKQEDDKDDNEAFTRDSKSDVSHVEETKLGEMDVKLKNIEDLIIDEALKFTGAHEGATDSKEVQEVKDKVISRLAAAYSLEKMRRALSEFKTSIAAQRYAMKNDKSNEMKEIDVDEKEADMKKKDVEPENNKCDNCEEKGQTENNMYPAENRPLPDGNSCEAIDRKCRNMLSADHGAMFYPLCKWHQLCYMCSPTGEEFETSCDAMIFAKAEVLCQGDMTCQWSARLAIEYLRDMYKTSPGELTDECEKAVCEPEEPPGDGTSNHLLFRIR